MYIQYDEIKDEGYFFVKSFFLVSVRTARLRGQLFVKFEFFPSRKWSHPHQGSCARIHGNIGESGGRQTGIEAL